VRVALTKNGVKHVQRVGEHLFAQYQNSMADMTEMQLTLIHQMYGALLERMRSIVAASKHAEDTAVARGGKS
jgi:hypothetical protein